MPENVRGGRLNALRELTSARVKEFLREPEAVFWVFLFPVLLAIVLGFAFREKPPDRIPIGVISSPASGKASGQAPASRAARFRVDRRICCQCER